MAENEWYIFAERHWYTVAEKGWHTIAENSWYTYGRKLTLLSFLCHEIDLLLYTNS